MLQASVKNAADFGLCRSTGRRSPTSATSSARPPRKFHPSPDRTRPQYSANTHPSAKRFSRMKIKYDEATGGSTTASGDGTPTPAPEGEATPAKKRVTRKAAPKKRKIEEAAEDDEEAEAVKAVKAEAKAEDEVRIPRCFSLLSSMANDSAGLRITKLDRAEVAGRKPAWAKCWLAKTVKGVAYEACEARCDAQPEMTEERLGGKEFGISAFPSSLIGRSLLAKSKLSSTSLHPAFSHLRGSDSNKQRAGLSLCFHHRQCIHRILIHHPGGISLPSRNL